MLHVAHHLRFSYEEYRFAGITRRQPRSSDKLPVSLYKYDTRPGTWRRVLSAERSKKPFTSSSSTRRSHPSPKRQRNDQGREGEKANETMGADADSVGEPGARRACQVVYDLTTQTFYLHGGTAQTPRDPTRGNGSQADERLDDFWSMKLERSVLLGFITFLTLMTCRIFIDLPQRMLSGALYSRLGGNSTCFNMFLT